MTKFSSCRTPFPQGHVNKNNKIMRRQHFRIICTLSQLHLDKSDDSDGPDDLDQSAEEGKLHPKFHKTTTETDDIHIWLACFPSKHVKSSIFAHNTILI